MSNGKTYVEDKIIATLINIPFTSNQFRLIHLAIQKTNGFKEADFRLAIPYICSRLGIAHATAVKTLASLRDMNILIMIESGLKSKKASVYSLNKNVEEWDIVQMSELSEKKKAIARHNIKNHSIDVCTIEKDEKNDVHSSDVCTDHSSDVCKNNSSDVCTTESNTSYNQTLLESNTSYVDFPKKSTSTPKKKKKVVKAKARKSKEKQTLKVFLRDQGIILARAQELYPDKDCVGVMDKFIRKTSAKNYKYADYRKAYYNWVIDEQGYNDYTLPNKAAQNNNTPKTFFRQQLEEEKAVMDWQYEQFKRMNGETDEDICIDQQTQIDF